MEDYIIYCLSGAAATDYSIANRMMAMNVKMGEWSDKMLDMAGIRRDILSPIYKSGTMVGKVTRETSAFTLLKEGTPVVTGGHDHACAALAMGIVNEGDVFDSMGTAETLIAVKDNMEIEREKFEGGFSIGRYVDGKKFYVMGGLQFSGGAVEWFGKNFIEDNNAGKSMYDVLNELSKEMKDEPTGIFFVPHLRGSGAPNVNPLARSAFIGLRSEHTKADMLKAVYEGTSFEFRTAAEALQRLSGVKMENLRIGGGGTKNHYWMAVKANILNSDLTIPEIEESAAMGAALLAGIGAGVYSSTEDAVKSLKVEKRYVKHDCKIGSRYDYLYQNGYTNLYDTLKSVNEVLNKF